MTKAWRVYKENITRRRGRGGSRRGIMYHATERGAYMPSEGKTLNDLPGHAFFEGLRIKTSIYLNIQS